ncbi:MAG: 30S ribosomal protein S16 [Candidatus Shikimatogenerans sp. JK-2022]|nr:30S ribosomal protein S16 [Candidatus Shikimatogenerans bostrichidophilus]
MVKIRLQRHGKKQYAFYYIVIANSKSPRDGKFIKKIGYYNPNLKGWENKIKINITDTLYWLKKGAQPTKTIKSILKHKKIKIN